jgi:aminoacylase
VFLDSRIGKTGHGSRFVEDTAAEKVAFVLNKVFDFRNQQELILDTNPNFKLGDVTTVNLTKMNGGIQVL